MLAVVACSTAHVGTGPDHTPVAIELVETAPIETTLDHPDIPDADVVWLDMIAHAHASIDLAEFYVSSTPDGRMEPVLRALEAAIGRGVRVRLLVEHSFVKTYPDSLERLAKAGAHVEHLDLHTGGILHAKYFVIDAREAFIGSQNTDWRALEHNYELGARIRDPAIVAALAAVFAADWARATGAPSTPAKLAPSDLVASPEGLVPDGLDREIPHLVALIDGATQTIHVELLTYLAGEWRELEDPLKRAAARGVDVQLAVSNWSLRAHTLPGLRELARVPHVTVRIITIPPWSGGFIPFARVAHAKLLVVDGVRGWLGTSNWEREYFYASRNVGVLIHDSRVASQLERFFDSGGRYSTPLKPDDTYTPPRIQ
jgi:phosphatidylserine/phosphatidylglycerophosphate/cardiolipin synthase-like enzyme